MAGVFNYTEMKNRRMPLPTAEGIITDDWQLSPDELEQQIECDFCSNVRVIDLVNAAKRYVTLSNDSCHPQIAALVFDVSGDHRALDFYFPITNILSEADKTRFYALLDRLVAKGSGLDIRLLNEQGKEVAKADEPRSIRYIVAGHIAEIFFYRQDILNVFLNKRNPRRICLYVNQFAFENDGGLAGGDFNPETESIQLVLSRLYEGFYGTTPGVTPFLHELGHMLDFFKVTDGGIALSSDGLLPGMRMEDGVLFSPRARELFVEGQKIELERYERYRAAQVQPTQTGDNTMPIGHPYVFQNPTEFIAGYFEMFFRNPNYFASQNPTLYAAFTELFRQDPRHAWPHDFDFYVRENQKVYIAASQNPELASQIIWQPGI